MADLIMVQIAVLLVATYTVTFLGSFSAIHCRFNAAIAALFSVALAYAASNGLAIYWGGKTAGMNQLLPFLMIGIGVDDAFVIVSAIDQTDARDSIENRMKLAIMHSGSSITITSLTNSLAFFLGCSTSLPGLSNFCFFAGLGVIFLYLTTLTVFASYMVWDMRRQMNQVGDCLGRCTCEEDSIWCCKGTFLT